jgi:hypothetical protein
MGVRVQPMIDFYFGTRGEAANLPGRRVPMAYLHARVIWLLLILTIRARRRLALSDGRAAFAPCLPRLFRRPLMRHASKMGEFSTFARDFALPVTVHRRESALPSFHQTSVICWKRLHWECH